MNDQEIQKLKLILAQREQDRKNAELWAYQVRMNQEQQRLTNEQNMRSSTPTKE